MDKKYWHRAKPDGSGSGEVVQPKWRKPVRNKFSQSESEMQMWEQELKEETKNWNEHITILPIYAYCDPFLPVGWIEGEEVYLVARPKSHYDDFKGVKRIWIEPKNKVTVISAREMSAKEIEELKRENERLKMDNLKKETANGTKPVLCDVFKGKIATLKEDFLPESEHWETGYWHLKKGTQVYIQGNESDGTCYIEYIEAVFSIDYRQLNIA